MFSITFAVLLQTAAAGVPVEPASNVDVEAESVIGAAQPELTQDQLEQGLAIDTVEETGPEVAELFVPKGTKIAITIESQIGSKISEAKEFFPIKLAHPVEVDGVKVLPAGITGEGQVVHAKKGGFAGSAGELVLAARYLEHDGRRIPLRSFRFVEEGEEFPFRGKDHSGLAIATNAVLGPIGMLIGGGETIIEPGTVATAKFRADETFTFAANASAYETQQQPAEDTDAAAEIPKAMNTSAETQPETNTDGLE